MFVRVRLPNNILQRDCMRHLNTKDRRRRLLILILLGVPTLYAGTPHMAYGTLKYQDGSTPASATFQAFVTGRSSEVLTQASFGCDYGSGIWSVQCGNFPSPWTAGERLRVNFNDGSGKTGSVELTLTHDPGDNAWVTTLSVQDGTVQLLLPDTTAERGATVRIPIYLEGLGVPDSVVAYQIRVGFDADVLIATGAFSTGTMTEPWGNPVAAPHESSMSVAGFTTNQPSARMVPDGGRLVYLEFLVHGIPDDPVSSSTEIYIDQAILYTIEANTAQSQIVSNTKVGVLTVQTGSNPATRDIPLYPDWNLLSLGIAPSPNTLPEAFGGMPIVYVFGYEAGQGPRTWVQNRPINDLELIDGLHGYWMKSGSSSTETWHVTGDAISVVTPIPLYTGWNMVGYLPTQSDQIDHAFQTLNALYSYIMGYEGGSGPRTWVRNRPINDLSQLDPLSGYWVKMDSAKSLVYPSSGYSFPSASPQKPVAVLNDTLSDIIVTPFWCDYYGPADGVLAEGDTIEALDPDGVVCGRTFLEADQAYFLIHVFGDDPTTADCDEGPAEGDTIRFTINGTEAAVDSGDATWQNMQSKQIRLSDAVQNHIAPVLDARPGTPVLHQNFPNPFNGETFISFQLQSESRVTLKIYDSRGRVVRTLLTGEMQERGLHRVKWSGNTQNGNRVSSGLYFYQLIVGEAHFSGKMILLQ